MIIFKPILAPLEQVSFFEATGAIVEIGSSLKSNYHYEFQPS